MKTRLTLLALLSALGLQPSALLQAATTIDASSRYAYGANLGWVDGVADTNNGAVIGEYVCSGYLYSANVGWINLGSGSPANAIRYQNLAADDFGVNHDGLGHLSGYAWGANIGWIAFESTGAPTVDLSTGRLSGYVWSANCGWISLSNATAQVRTIRIAASADTDGDGMADAWEREHWGSLRPLCTDDADDDGASNHEEYLAGTDPRDTNSLLRITSIQRGQFGDPSRVDLAWSSVPTRFYAVQISSDLATNSLSDFYVSGQPGESGLICFHTNSSNFYRVRAFRHLTP